MSEGWSFSGKKEVFDLYAPCVSPGKVAFFESAGIEFSMGRREGPYIWDISGDKRLIDCHCNGGVFNLGHRNPEVIDPLSFWSASLQRSAISASY